MALNTSREIISSREGFPNQPDGFQRFHGRGPGLCDQNGLGIMAVTGETTCIYYWAPWDFLTEQVER